MNIRTKLIRGTVENNRIYSTRGKGTLSMDLSFQKSIIPNESVF